MSETETAVDAEGDAAFGAGFGGKDVATVEKKPDPAPSTGEKAEQPEYVQISKAEWDKVMAAAEKTAAHEKQFSTVFGTIGKTKQTLEQSIAELRAQAEGRKGEISNAAYTKLKDQFPELAEMTKEMVEARLANLKPAAEPDEAALTRIIEQRQIAREMTQLTDSYPDWMTIVGAPPAEGHPPVDTPFRQWLAGKDENYQKSVSDSDFPADIERAIRRFQRETKAQAKPTPARDTQTGRFRDAVQQRGDGAPPTATNDLDAAFESGFRGR